MGRGVGEGEGICGGLCVCAEEGAGGVRRDYQGWRRWAREGAEAEAEELAWFKERMRIELRVVSRAIGVARRSDGKMKERERVEKWWGGQLR